MAATDPKAASRVKLHSNGNSTRHTEELLFELLADSQATSATTTTTSSTTATTAVTCQTAPLPHHDTTTTTLTTTAMTTTTTTAQRPGSRLFIVADEVEASFQGLFDRLRNNVEDLHVWAASYSHRHRPEGMAERCLLACVRSTPTVMRRMETAVSFSTGSVYRWVRLPPSLPTLLPLSLSLFLSFFVHPVSLCSQHTPVSRSLSTLHNVSLRLCSFATFQRQKIDYCVCIAV